MRTLLTALAVASALALTACGDDSGAGPDATIDAPSGDILAQLQGLPEVDHVVEQPTTRAGYRYFELWFTQPIDHDHPEAGTFLQYATLIHTDAAAPLVLLHTGYGNWYYDYPGEVARLFHANQLVIEHRFFRTSRPPALADWAFLTIAQAAADHHRITVAMRRLYRGPVLETGASKGGMTSIYHRRFFPDDVDVTLAYVAPISFAAPDYAYEPYLEGVGPPACKAALRAVQAEMLRSRRAALESRAAAEAVERGRSYQRITLPAAVESAVISLEWAFWQYAGVGYCGAIPPVTGTDDELWDFLQVISEVGSSDDDNLAEFEAYYYQAETELGYPGTMDEHLDGLTAFPSSAYDGAYPQGVTRPAYAATAMTDVDSWVRASGARILFLYGEWDPWSGGMFDPAGRPDDLRVVAPQAPHGAGITDLSAADQAEVLARLRAWTGVEPDLTNLRKPGPALRSPRPPRPIARR
ncbi:MAG: aminopeptidase [Myxococcales bacterium]|nr:aminopeptidase [Myxococcales bacterium]